MSAQIKNKEGGPGFLSLLPPPGCHPLPVLNGICHAAVVTGTLSTRHPSGQESRLPPKLETLEVSNLAKT